MSLAEIIEELPKLSAEDRTAVWNKLAAITEADVPESFRRGMRDIAEGRVMEMEQAIYGSIFRNIEEVRRAVGKFVQDYNAEWRVEKNGFRSPRQAREAWFAALSKQAA